MKFVTDKSKGILGSPDSVELWTQIIDQIPEELLRKPGLRILNIACGHCTEALILAKRMLALGIGPSEVQKSFTLLDKYQVFTNPAKMLYGFENVITADFLTWGDTNPMEFDIILGNPPYNSPLEKSGNSKRGSGTKLWIQFIFKINELVSENGFVALITPSQWMSGGINSLKGRKSIISDIFCQKQLLVAEPDSNRYFPEIGVQIGWWLMQNKPVESLTKFILRDTVSYIDMKKSPLLSVIPNCHSFSIVNKVMCSEGEKISSLINSAVSIGSETDHPTEENTIKAYQGGSDKTNNLLFWYYPKKNYPRFCEPKIIVPVQSRYWQPYFDDEGVDLGFLVHSIFVDPTWTREGIYSVFYSNVFKYLCKTLQIDVSGFTKTNYIRSLPKLDMSRVWTDAEIYEYFDLTQEEIEYIESNVK